MKKIFRKSAAFSLTALLALSCAACTPSQELPPVNDDGGQQEEGYDPALRIDDTRALSPQDYTVFNLAATDDFGRTVFTVDGRESEDRYVGMFYFLWLGQNSESEVGIFDMSEITEDGAHPEYFTQVDSRDTPAGAAHFWGKPVWGYYNSLDEWVMRKQVEMLTMAGVDFLVFDCTNAFTYPQVTGKLLAILKEYQSKGWNVPQFMYYLAADTQEGQFLKTLKEVYNFAYASGEYRSLWFAPDGKPIITLNEKFYYADNYGLNADDPVEKAISELFQFRCRQWPNEFYQEDGIPWMEFAPNEVFDRQPVHNGWMNVSVAQHPTVRFSDTVGTHGRGYDFETGFNDHERYREDLNYISQWQTVLDNKDEVRFTFVTGWNEWIATKLGSNNNHFSVDTFISEFSRDLEPSENLGDNSFLLTAQKIRENNFVAAKHYRYPALNIDIGQDDPQWGSVTAFADFTGDCPDRDCQAMAGRQRYTDTSGRNDIASVKVARGGEYLYFRVETVSDITPYEAGDSGWMNIRIKTAGAKETYLGYDYILNRDVNGNVGGVYHAEGKTLKRTGSCDLHTQGNLLFVRVKLSDLGLSERNYDICFKVTDNVSEGSILDYYRTGDSAPIGRLDYRYGY